MRLYNQATVNNHVKQYNILTSSFILSVSRHIESGQLYKIHQ